MDQDGRRVAVEGVGVAPGETWETEAWVVEVAAGPTALTTLAPTGLTTDLHLS